MTAEPTPRTDALWDQAASNLTGYDITEKARRYEIALWEHARQLERELAQSQALLQNELQRRHNLGSQLEQAQSRLAEVEKDAERYRWLHNGDVDGLLVMRGHVEDEEDIANLIDGDELDAAIDEAIKRSSAPAASK